VELQLLSSVCLYGYHRVKERVHDYRNRKKGPILISFKQRILPSVQREERGPSDNKLKELGIKETNGRSTEK
jgi:hypothetical protein